jgi:hypothetical protein
MSTKGAERGLEAEARRAFLQNAARCGIGAAPAVALLLSGRGALAKASGIGGGDMGKHPPKQEYIGKTGGTEKGKTGG